MTIGETGVTESRGDPFYRHLGVNPAGLNWE